MGLFSCVWVAALSAAAVSDQSSEVSLCGVCVFPVCAPPHNTGTPCPSIHLYSEVLVGVGKGVTALESHNGHASGCGELLQARVCVCVETERERKRGV